jgi:hypothetical protein
MGRSSVKVIGSNGQISLGKRFAGRHVQVEEQEPGVWLVRTVKIVPDSERRIHEPAVARDLREALDWAISNPANRSNAGELLEKLAADD